MADNGGMNTHHVRIEWDAEASVWFVVESTVPGLATEAATVEAMLEKLDVLVPELLAENGIGEVADVPFELLAQRHAIAHRGC